LKDVTLRNGSVVRVEAGELQVPESRRRPSPRRVTIPYYRLKSESPNPGVPIFLLAGGPGGSWLDQFTNDENFKEVAFYRTIADVVLFDQRGGGHSQPAMGCSQAEPLPADEAFNLAAVGRAMRIAATACRDQWLALGVDLAAYNTVENAADVNDLRLALGYDKVTLVGGSYGSHLALAFMRHYADAVDRAVLFGIEGPDHTWDNPSGMLNTLRRIAAATEQSPAFAGRLPPGGLIGALERVVARLELAPAEVGATDGAAARKTVVNADLIRRVAATGAGRRNDPEAWPMLVLALDRGDYSFPARATIRNRTVRVADPVHHSMDCSSGVSNERRRQYRDDPAATLIGDINFEYETLCAVWPADDLGEAFRTPLVSSIPTVIFHGTWDMSTPLENAREVVATLRNGQLVEVIGGNHGALYNLYERWEPMHARMSAFLKGQDVRFPATVDDMAAVHFTAP
jgi:pimeloyl-ACP methyl ester carboxylesterase